MPRHPSGLFPSVFPKNTLHAPLFFPHTCQMPRLPHPSLFQHTNNIHVYLARSTDHDSVQNKKAQVWTYLNYWSGIFNPHYDFFTTKTRIWSIKWTRAVKNVEMFFWPIRAPWKENTEGLWEQWRGRYSNMTEIRLESRFVICTLYLLASSYRLRQ